MKVEILKKSKDKVSYRFDGTDEVFMNTLRRMIVDEVPTMAVETVEIVKNTSALYDEMLAHRLGLTPLKTDLKSYELPSRCTCNGEGCARCQLTLTLKTKAAGSTHASLIKSEDPKVIPVHDEMPVCKLLKGQELELSMKAVLGKGKEHAKFAPGLAFYQHFPIVEILNKSVDAESVVKSCPTGVFESKGGKLQIKDIEKCHLCNSCMDQFPKDVKVTESENDFIFTLESWGQLKHDAIMKKAAEEFKLKIDEFAKLL